MPFRSCRLTRQDVDRRCWPTPDAPTFVTNIHGLKQTHSGNNMTSSRTAVPSARPRDKVFTSPSSKSTDRALSVLYHPPDFTRQLPAVTPTNPEKPEPDRPDNTAETRSRRLYRPRGLGADCGLLEGWEPAWRGRGRRLQRPMTCTRLVVCFPSPTGLNFIYCRGFHQTASRL